MAGAFRCGLAGRLGRRGVVPAADRRWPRVRAAPSRARPRQASPRAATNCHHRIGGSMSRGRVVALVAIATLVAAFFVFDLKSYLSVDYFRAQQAAIDAYFRAHPLRTTAVYFAVYVAVTGLSLRRRPRNRRPSSAADARGSRRRSPPAGRESNRR